MRLAMSQIAWEAQQECEALAALAQEGLCGLEIAPTRIAGPAPYATPSKAAVYALEIRQEFGFEICSMQSIWFGQSGSMFGPQRDELMEYTRAAVVFAQQAGAKNLVFGCPKNRVIPQGESDEAAVSFFKQIGDFAAGHGAVLALEANPPVYGTNFMNTTASAFEMARRVGSAGCRVNLDVGTMVINGEDVAGLAGQVGEIHHVHLSEPGLDMIQKRALHKELAALLRSEGYAGYVSVEMKQRPMEDIRRAGAYLAEVFG